MQVKLMKPKMAMKEVYICLIGKYINLNEENIEKENVCCAKGIEIHRDGVCIKKNWILSQLKRGHVLRKLNNNYARVFIEYGPLEEEFVPVVGDNYFYICCLAVEKIFRNKKHGRELLNYVINQAKAEDKNGICVISSARKRKFLADKKYFRRFGFKLVDKAAPYFELLSLKLNESENPRFTDRAKRCSIYERGVVVYYSDECPYINKCVLDIQKLCEKYDIELTLNHVNTVDKAKSMPFVMNNFCIFYNGKFISHEIISVNRLKRILKVK